jgi:hypothetical protein
MTTTNTLDYLGVPLTLLPYLHDLDEFPGIPPEGIELLRSDYSAEQFKSIVDAMHFVTVNPELDLLGRMPGLRHTNEQIHDYIAKFLQSVYDADDAEEPARAAAPVRAPAPQMTAPPPAPQGVRPMPAPPPAPPAPAKAGAFGAKPAVQGSSFGASKPAQPRFGAR